MGHTTKKEVIFLSYRRADAGQVAGRIFERLRVAFPQYRVFMDTEEIPLGTSFRIHIGETLKTCAATLVIMGPHWAQSTRGFWPFKRRRLFDPRDLVRIEIECSLENKIKIIPLLVEGARMPDGSQLPESIRSFREYQAFTLNSIEFRRDVEELVRQLSSLLGLTAPNDVIEVPRLQKVLRERKVRAGCIKHPPLSDFCWVSKDDAKFSGLYIDMCRVVGQSANIDVEFIPVDWVDIPLRVFREMELDMVLSVFQTPERSRYCDFTALFHKVNVVGLVKRENDRIGSIKDLETGNGTVVVTKGEAGWEYVVHQLRLPKHRLIVVENFDLGAMMALVESGGAEIAICDEVTCAGFENRSSSVKRVFTADPLDTCRNGILVPSNEPDWRRWVGEVFGRARENADIRKSEESILSEPGQLIRRYS